MVRKIRFINICLIILVLSITAGCSFFGGANGVDSDTPPKATAEDTPIALSPEPPPAPTPTLVPTPIPANAAISDQILDENGELVADEVTLPAPGWLVIYLSKDGEPDAVIGRVPLAAGVHENVRVAVDTDLATEQLFAGVHLDVGAEGVFEFPGQDKPFPGEPETEFTVELKLPRPQLETAEQDVAEDGMITLARVETQKPAWVLIHADDDGEIGSVLGGVLLEAGAYENVPLTIDWRRATPTLHAVLHEDDGRTGVIDYPDGDKPILVNGLPVVSTFAATYPPEVIVYDQPAIDRTVTIERVISRGPGWVAVYNEVDGQPGFIIGSAPLKDGLNEAVTVTLVQSAITGQLFARLHEDTEPGGAFNFPAQDPAVRYNNRLPNAAGFRIDAGALAFIRDQQPAGNTISVNVIVSPVEGWAAVYADNDGQPGELLGNTWFPVGINRNVVIELAPMPKPGTLFLVLHEDLGEPETFETGIDMFLTDDNNRPIRIPFVLFASPGN
ncbi:MAG: hypothetical protein KBF17_07340 [Candidatus Promineofilum sp.]|nr:hypothetical protein [Promineifilum sp.]MBP9657316.1 hypothetical protein [Promineifilum sp.]